MTKKDFFVLVVKLFGLYTLMSSLFAFLPYASAFFTIEQTSDLIAMLKIGGMVILMLGLAVLLIFYADIVVVLLKLDKGFDNDRIELGNLNGSEIIKVGTFIVGGLMMINNIPPFFTHTYFSFKSTVQSMENNDRETFRWILNGVYIVLGYLLMRNYHLVAKLLDTNKKE